MPERGLGRTPFDKGILKVFGNIDIPASQQAKPVTIPVSGTIIRTYGWETSGDGQKLLHPGIDIAAAEPSAPVQCGLEGSVRYIGKNQRLGTYLELDHGGGMVTVYGNCGEVIVVEGQEVQGEKPSPASKTRPSLSCILRSVLTEKPRIL